MPAVSATLQYSFRVASLYISFLHILKRLGHWELQAAGRSGRQIDDIETSNNTSLFNVLNQNDIRFYTYMSQRADIMMSD